MFFRYFCVDLQDVGFKMLQVALLCTYSSHACRSGMLNAVSLLAEQSLVQARDFVPDGDWRLSTSRKLQSRDNPT